MRPYRTTALAACLPLLALTLGCGGESLGEVSGKVTLANQPVSSAIVNFFPEQGVPVACFVTDGEYVVPALLYGKYRVSVTSVGEEFQVDTSGARPLKPGEVDPLAKNRPAAKKGPNIGPPIPPKYQSIDTSQLSCTVDRGKVEFAIALD